MGHPDSGYIVLAPGGVQELDLSGTERRYRLSWHDMESSSLEVRSVGSVQGGRKVALKAPHPHDYLALLALEH
jgi:hypothetical protein